MPSFKQSLLVEQFQGNYLNQSGMGAFYQSALRRHGLHEDVTPSSRADSSEKGLMVVVPCSDLPVNRCEGDRA